MSEGTTAETPAHRSGGAGSGAPLALVLALLIGLLPRRQAPRPGTDGQTEDHEPAGRAAEPGTA
ncbi:hypothetical protein ACFWRV_20750 [Streptomyces sp. NPDC058576]|uniref:hypothetical protein n=1 Tax=Streptomyces sp. NPDC058576 TaxID=3346547 RepID=UPI00364E5477